MIYMNRLSDGTYKVTYEGKVIASGLTLLEASQVMERTLYGGYDEII